MEKIKEVNKSSEFGKKTVPHSISVVEPSGLDWLLAAAGGALA
jgi:hypothetical protein